MAPKTKAQQGFAQRHFHVQPQLPVAIQSLSCRQMSDGLEIQNGLISRPLANSHSARPIT